ncbi:MAG: ATP-binding protein [Flavobacteriia bacterium]|nr:ATP-binding protein [Flavobacteriia bacterium]
MIKRNLSEIISKKLNDNKIIVILGARQVGKTTLLESLTKKYKKVLHFNGDDSDTRSILSEANSTKLKYLIGNADCVFIDEAQRIENVGLTLKIIHDNRFKCKVFASGSSAFEIANKFNEPLTGRKWEYQLYPFSFEEMVKHTNFNEESRNLSHRLVFGYYPDVVNNPSNEREILEQIANSYLYKDILNWERIKKPNQLDKLIKALAFQVGNLVSYNELGQISGLNNETVEHYINLLEKAFVVFRLGTYNRNLRNELKKTRKIYFYDNGIRNAIIKQYMPIELRNDIGQLWENFIISERIKHNQSNQHFCNTYFWRNLAKQEIDYIEEWGGKIDAFEFKWQSKNENIKFPNMFLENYKPNKTKLITKDNFHEFICP